MSDLKGAMFNRGEMLQGMPVAAVAMSIRSILVFLIGFSGYSTLQAQDAAKPHVLVIGIDGLRPDAMQKAKDAQY